MLEVASLEGPVLAVLGGGALALRPGLDAALRDRLVADARTRPDDWDVFLGTAGGYWLLAGRPDRYGTG